jgi:hypothetical protein
MTPLAAVPFYQSKMLEDIGAVTAGGNAYLVTVDHTYQMAPESPEGPSETTVWRFWAPDKQEGHFHEAAHENVVFPVAVSIVMTARNDRLTAIALENRSKPAVLLTAEAALPKIGSFRSPVPIAIDSREVGTIQLPPRETWSTAGIQPEEWLFHPSIAALPGAGEVAIAMNTADGRALAWTSNAQKLNRAALAPAALRPVMFQRDGKNRLLYLRMPPNWSVFYRDPRNSSEFAPEALPLVMADLDASGAVAHATDLSAERGIGPVYDFAAATPDGKRLVLAAIVGPWATPELRIYVSADSAAPPRLLHSQPVRGAPFRLAMTTGGERIVIGLAYLARDGFDVEGVTAALK